MANTASTSGSRNMECKSSTRSRTPAWYSERWRINLPHFSFNPKCRIVRSAAASKSGSKTAVEGAMIPAVFPAFKTRGRSNRGSTDWPYSAPAAPTATKLRRFSIYFTPLFHQVIRGLPSQDPRHFARLIHRRVLFQRHFELLAVPLRHRSGGLQFNREPGSRQHRDVPAAGHALLQI